MVEDKQNCTITDLLNRVLDEGYSITGAFETVKETKDKSILKIALKQRLIRTQMQLDELDKL